MTVQTRIRHTAAALVVGALTAGAALTATSPASAASGPVTADNTPSVSSMKPEALSPRAAHSPNRYATSFSGVGPGSVWQDTRAVQYLLLAQGYRTNWETAYGASTRAAVTAYQRAKKLPVTGVADNRTLSGMTPAIGVNGVAYRTWAIQTLLKKHTGTGSVGQRQR